jgi:hypothetical protein
MARSGSTIFRRYLEEVTGIVTGSDMSLDMALNL